MLDPDQTPIREQMKRLMLVGWFDLKVHLHSDDYIVLTTNQSFNQVMRKIMFPFFTPHHKHFPPRIRRKQVLKLDFFFKWEI